MLSARSQRSLEKDLVPVWRALSDPTRRRLLDLLRERPRTTGELADAFTTSRFAVMKHLGVLVDARLVIPRKEGRERWNHLNAVPLQQMYERWVRPYEACWSGALLRLKDSLEAEQGERGETTMAKTKQDEVGICRTTLEVPIAAPKERVWKALVQETTSWWPADFYTGKAPKGFTIDARPGGLALEDWGNGDGRVWFNVVSVKKGEFIELAGRLFPEFGGPGVTTVRLELKERGDKTLFTLSDAVLGKASVEQAKSFEEGWKALFQDAFKKYVEKS